MSALPIAISVNMDSLSEAYGYPAGYEDPTFTVGFERLANLAAKHGLPLTLYLIGKDMENPAHAKRVRQWSEMGCEIGNHSYSHHFNLGALSKAGVHYELAVAHQLIANATGVAPVGFIAPAWSSAKKVVATLIELGYRYDTSVFPSVFLYPLVAKSFLAHVTHPAKAIRLLGRRDWLDPLCAPREPFLVDHNYRKVKAEDGLLVMPLPTASRLQVCRWHTTGYFFGWQKHFEAMAQLAATHDGFYYVLHPADFLGAEDLSSHHQQYLERMDLPLAEKLARLDEAFAILATCGRPVTTMAQKAAAHRKALLNV